MTRTELLAGIAIIIGIPSFLVLFLTGFQTVGILVFIIVCGLAYYYYDAKRPDFTQLSVNKKLEILDHAGKRATVTNCKTVRANHSGLSEFVCHRISADGTLMNFSYNFGPPRAGEASSIEPKMKAGVYIVRIPFPHPLRKWEKREVTLTYDLIDSFTGKTESGILVVGYPTRKAKFEIQLPQDHPCLDARVFYRSGAHEYQMDPPDVSNRNRTIVWEGKGLPRGSEYEVEWDW